MARHIRRALGLIIVIVILYVYVRVDAVGVQNESGPRVVPCANGVAALRDAAFNLDVGLVTLQDGKGCVKADAGDPQCEWAVELTRAERWGTNRRFLLAVVNADHLGGTGAWDSVFLYVCAGDRYVPVFSERYLYGAKIELSADADLWITGGVWRAKDPTCCPSRMRRSHHVWSGRPKRFVVTESQLTPVK